MICTLILFCGCGQSIASHIEPVRPDFAVLVPPQADDLAVTPEQCCRNADIREAASFAAYFDKMWDRMADRTATKQDYSDCLLALRQFDDTLSRLNPKPTLIESIARVRAYRILVALVRSNVERAIASGRPPPITPENVDQQFKSVLKRYASVFRHSG